jgi:hypothetical protein
MTAPGGMGYGARPHESTPTGTSSLGHPGPSKAAGGSTPGARSRPASSPTISMALDVTPVVGLGLGVAGPPEGLHESVPAAQPDLMTSPSFEAASGEGDVRAKLRQLQKEIRELNIENDDYEQR